MIITQVHLVLGTIKGHSKVCSFVTVPKMSQVLRERAIGMLTAGMSTRGVAREMNVNISTISCLQRHFREFVSTFNRPHNCRPRDRLRPATWQADEAVGLHKRGISVQTVRNRHREAHLGAHCPHQGLDLTSNWHRNWPLWANAHLRWPMARWRSRFSMDKSSFQLYWADGRQRVWHCVGKRFADFNVVNRVPHCGGGVMVWTGISYGQRTQLHFIDGNLNAQRYRDEILRSIVMSFIRRHHLMFQHDNAQPHVTRVWTQFLEAENVPVLTWPAYSPDMSPIEHVWDALDRRERQSVPSSSKYPTTSHSRWRGVGQHSTSHNKQPD